MSAPNTHRWWNGLGRERYWLEVTDRPDIGINLKAPTVNKGDKGFWGYSFVAEVNPGDVIFHYDKNVHAIIGRSVATGITWSDVITWGARGKYARAAGIQPYLREGIHLGLEVYSPLRPPVTLGDIRATAAEINKRLDKLEQAVYGPLYYPFERGAKRETRPIQGYLFKLPAFFLEVFPHLDGPVAEVLVQSAPTESLGTAYRRASENIAVAQRDPFAVDPSIVERGLRGHIVTQNKLADTLVKLGMCPRSPAPTEPSFDLAWISDSKMWVAEVKSLTRNNEEKQLRLGLGQVLRYAHLLGRNYRLRVYPVLVTERRPTSADWMGLCDQHKVILMWPPFEEKIRRLQVETKNRRSYLSY